MPDPETLHGATRSLVAHLRRLGEVVAAERVQSVVDVAFTTSSEWIGALSAALADARGLIAASDWRERIAAHRSVEVVAARLPGARSRQVLCHLAVGLAYALVVPIACAAGLCLLVGGAPAGTPSEGAWVLVAIGPAIALAIVWGTWRHLPLAGRLLAKEVVWLAAVALAFVIYGSVS